MRPLFLSLFLGLLLATTSHSSRAAPLVVDISDHLVAIATDFSGSEVLLFGSIDGEGDVVVIVRGPTTPLVMHRKSRVLGVWVNSASMTFERAPSFYSIAASRDLAEIASPEVLARHEMGLDNIKIELPRGKVSPNLAEEWQAGLIRNQQDRDLYRADVGAVTFLGNQLFRVNFDLPANVPTGTYQVQVYLLRQGRVVSAQTTPLFVSKVGVEAEVFDFAHRYSAAYGIIAILVALVAGWLGNAIFRKM